MAGIIIYLSFLLFSINAYADVTIQINNNSDKYIEYKIDNFRYIDKDRKWKSVPPILRAIDTVFFTTKYGYLELRIIDPLRNQTIISYIPSGNNKEVTIVIENDDDNYLKLKASRYIGI